MKTKETNKKRKGSGMWILTVFLVATVGIATGTSVMSQYKQIRELRDRQKQVQNAIDEEIDRSVELENQQAYYESDVYIEEIAREQLGLIRPDEILIINRSAP